MTLYVRDPARSQEFYQDLFGLVVSEQPAMQSRRMLQAPGETDGLSILLRSRGRTTDLPLWLSVEVGSVSEVLDLYLLAIMMGARAMLPRKRGRRWSTEVTDPDGNRISIWTCVEQDENEDDSYAAFRPHRWEWRSSAPHGEDIDDAFEATRQPLDSCLIEPQQDDEVFRMPGRSAAGADAIDRRSGHRHQGRQGGGTPSPALGYRKTPRQKE